MSWKKFRLIKHHLDFRFFLKKLLIFCKKFFVSKYLPERFKSRPSFQRCSFLIFELSIKWKLCMRYLAFRVLFTAQIKAEFRRVFTIKFETNSLFTPKATHSLAILIKCQLQDLY